MNEQNTEMINGTQGTTEQQQVAQTAIQQAPVQQAQEPEKKKHWKPIQWVIDNKGKAIAIGGTAVTGLTLLARALMKGRQANQAGQEFDDELQEVSPIDPNY